METHIGRDIARIVQQQAQIIEELILLKDNVQDVRNISETTGEAVGRLIRK